MSIRLYVERGGKQNKALKIECQEAFHSLFLKAGLAGRMPKVIPCGSRGEAFDRFCMALSAKGHIPHRVLLLVDSEGPVSASTKWEHVKHRPDDGWDKPAAATEANLYFMVECMESWFLVDMNAVAEYFGHGFSRKRMPGNPEPEKAPKEDVLNCLKAASRQSKKGEYTKGRHSFDILARLDPALLKTKCPRARELFDALDTLDRGSSPP